MSEVTSYHLTGDWRHIIDDGLVDPDALPDEALPTGHVEFIPVFPRVAVSGTPDTAYTVSSFKALIAAGVLTDLQGREGVHIAGKIGDSPIRWKAITHLEFRGQKISYPTVEFILEDDARLTGIIESETPGSPITIYSQRLEELTDQARDYRDEARDAHQDVLAALEGVEGIPEILGALASYNGYPSDWRADDTTLRTELVGLLDQKSGVDHKHPAADISDSTATGRSVLTALDAAAARAAIGAKSDDYHPTWGQVTNKPSEFSPAAHTHTVADITATGTRGATTFLRGDGSWVVPTNTTYALMTQAVADTGTSTTANSINALVLKGAIWQRVTGSSTTPVTTLGQDLNKAADAAAARTILGSIADSDPRLTDARTPTSHTHTTAQITGLDTALAGKAPTSHTHSVADLTASGTRDTTTYLRGDGTWSVPPTGGQPGPHTHLSTDISDSTATGRSVLTAATAAAARTAIGAGTSSLAIGTTSTTAKAGNYVPTWTEVTSKPTTFAPIIGDTATTAVAGNDSRLTDARTPTAHTHTTAQVTGLDTALASKVENKGNAAGLWVGTTATLPTTGEAGVLYVTQD